MVASRFDKTFDEMLEGKIFQGVSTIDYFKADFSDNELDKLTKQELINLFSKAFVVICLEQSERTKLLNQSSELLTKLVSHYKIYPELKDIQENEIDLAINKAKIRILLSQSFIQLLKKLPEIKSKAKKSIPTSGGTIRAANVERTKALKLIEKIDYPKIKHIMHLRGRRTVFANNMMMKYKVFANNSTILRLVDKLNKLAGITQKNK